MLHGMSPAMTMAVFSMASIICLLSGISVLYSCCVRMELSVWLHAIMLVSVATMMTLPRKVTAPESLSMLFFTSFSMSTCWKNPAYEQESDMMIPGSFMEKIPPPPSIDCRDSTGEV